MPGAWHVVEILIPAEDGGFRSNKEGLLRMTTNVNAKGGDSLSIFEPGSESSLGLSHATGLVGEIQTGTRG